MRAYDFSPLFRYSIGFDRLEQLLDTVSRRQDQAPSYPPYNIESVDENAYRITMAVAGFGEEDLDIIQKESSLVVAGQGRKADNGVSYLHQGIATRAFERRFDIADHVKVVGANLDNGMPTIDLEREVPEALKPRQIEIKKGAPVGIVDKAKKFRGTQEKQAA